MNSPRLAAGHRLARTTTRTHRAFAASAAIVLTTSLAARAAHAQDASSTPPLFGALAPPLAFLKSPPILRSGHAGGGPGSGWIVGVDAGLSTRFALGGDPSAGGLGFGARLGYAFRGGFQVDARYDDLGVHLRDLDPNGVLQATTLGARYELPLFILPFAEVRIGPAFDATSAWFAAAVALGVAVPIARPLSIDLTARDWLVPAGDSLHSILTVQLGLTVRFGGA